MVLWFIFIVHRSFGYVLEILIDGVGSLQGLVDSSVALDWNMVLLEAGGLVDLFSRVMECQWVTGKHRRSCNTTFELLRLLLRL